MFAAAPGGMVVPEAFYIAVCSGVAGAVINAWGIAMTTDMAIVMASVVVAVAGFIVMRIRAI